MSAASNALPQGDAASLAAFRSLIESAAQQSDAERPVTLTDRLVGPHWSPLLRRCAIVHAFTPALLGLLGGLDAVAAEERYAAFTELSLMQINADSLSVHERWRAPLWRWWLAPEQAAEFRAVNEQLVAWFTQPSDPRGDDSAGRRRMFHLLGCRLADGLALFEQQFRLARHRRRFSECALLLGLVREYEPLLDGGQRAQLRYHEGKLAGDGQRWDAAVALLQTVVADQQAGARLRLNAQVRVAHALRQLGRNADAQALLRLAMAQAEREADAGRSRWRVLAELGEIQRNAGFVEAAASTLQQALDQAGDDPEADRAGLLNALGTAQLRGRDTPAAIASFRASLAQLAHDGDGLRPGTVLNNLGLAQLEACDWAQAEASLRDSLACKREAGDRAGQATTWLNLARALAAQGRSQAAHEAAAQALAVFTELGRSEGVAMAQTALQRHAQAAANSDATPAWQSAAAHGGAGTGTAAGAAVGAGAGTGAGTGAGASRGLPWWAWVLIVLGLGLLALLGAAP